MVLQAYSSSDQKCLFEEDPVRSVAKAFVDFEGHL